MNHNLSDPVEDFERYDAEQHRKLSRLPICCICGDHIQQDDAVRISGAWYCDGCLEDMREETLDDEV